MELLRLVEVVDRSTPGAEWFYFAKIHQRLRSTG